MTDRRRRSPASTGLTPGLFLALAAALAVLAANSWWLFPSLDTDSVVYLEGARSFLTGGPASVPVGDWTEESPRTGLSGRGTLYPWLMSLPGRFGLARPYVGGLWLLAGGLAATVLGVSWVAGGASGTLGGVLAGIFVLLSPLTVAVGTALRPELPAAACVALLLGLLAYQPRWSLLHGAVGTLAWLLHPAGAGAVAAAVVWPWVPQASSAATETTAPAVAHLRKSIDAALPAAIFLVAGVLRGIPALPAVMDGPGPWVGSSALADPVAWAAGGLEGVPGGLAGAMILVLLAGLVWWEAIKSGTAPAGVPWHDPMAPTVLASRVRPAAAVLVLALAIDAGMSHAEGELARPGYLVVVPLAVLAGVALARMRKAVSASNGRILMILVFLWLGGSAWGATREYRMLRSDGVAHTEQKWVESPVIRWLDAHPWGSIRVFASDPHLVYLQTLHAARTLPSDPAEMDAFAERFEGDPPGAIVLTEDAVGRADQLAAALGLDVVVKVPEGVVLFRGG